MPTLIRLGKAIADRRRELGLTQKDLGARIGIDLNSVSRIETGKVDISQSRLSEIAVALETTAADLQSAATPSKDIEHRERLAVMETLRAGQGYRGDAPLTLPSKVHAHAHRLLATLADEGADSHGLDQAKRLFLEPERYTYSAHGRVVMMDEGDIIKDMDAIAEYVRTMVHERKRLAEDLERPTDE